MSRKQSVTIAQLDNAALLGHECTINLKNLILVEVGKGEEDNGRLYILDTGNSLQELEGKREQILKAKPIFNFDNSKRDLRILAEIKTGD